MLPVVNPAVPAAGELQIGVVANQKRNRQPAGFLFCGFFFNAKDAENAKEGSQGALLISLRFS